MSRRNPGSLNLFGPSRSRTKNRRDFLDLVRLLRGNAVALPETRMSRKHSLLAELVAEFLGTFVLILFGVGVVAMVVLFPSGNPGDIIHGGYTNITLGWGLGVTMGIYI